MRPRLRRGADNHGVRSSPSVGVISRQTRTSPGPGAERPEPVYDAVQLKLQVLQTHLNGVAADWDVAGGEGGLEPVEQFRACQRAVT